MVRGNPRFAFDTIYAEGQRKYVESLSAPPGSFSTRCRSRRWISSRDFLFTAIATEQLVSGAVRVRSSRRPPRFSDYLRLLFAYRGSAHCLGTSGVLIVACDDQ